MYKNVLVISDNLYLCKRIEEVLQKKSITGSEFSFAISPFSNLLEFENGLIANSLFVVNLKDEKDVAKIIGQYDLILSIHCKQLFPASLVNKVKCINIHPGYNPFNRGWYPQVFSILNDEVIGATIHEIDEEIDHGAIIDRILVEKDNVDTSGTLYNKILEAEISLFSKNIASILQKTYTTQIPETEGKLYLKKDFNEICKIDLKEVNSFENFIKKMRALTHHDFKNAHYVDPLTNEKIYISINISR